MSEVHVNGFFPVIPAEDLPEFKRRADLAIKLVQDEPGTLRYDWFLSADETSCAVRETYVDVAALEAHIAHMRVHKPGVRDIAPGVEIDLFGEPCPALQAIAEDLGARLYQPYGR